MNSLYPAKKRTAIRKFLLLSTLAFCQLEANNTPSKRPAFILDERYISDLRLLANGSFAPLQGFMNQADYQSVISNSRLADDSLFPLPIVLPIPCELSQEALENGSILLKDNEGHDLAILHVEDIYAPELEKECLSSLGTLDTRHPSAAWILARTHHNYIGGKIEALPYLAELDQSEGVWSPEETRDFFQTEGLQKIVAFQTRNPLHRAHVALIERCLKEAGDDATLFLHPVIGPTQEEDISAGARMKCYRALLPYLDKWPLHLGYLPLAMRMAGPKEALLHALIRKNYGATHFIIGRDHAGPSSKDSNNRSFYAPYAAQDFVKMHAEELGIEILTAPEMIYIEESQEYISQSELASGQTAKQISGSELRKSLQCGLPLPTWFSFPEVEQILRQYYAHKNGLCIYLTGLPSSGKSTLATALKKRIEACDPLLREAIILDGDIVRAYLSTELGFSKKDRSINVQRIGYIASLIAQTGGIAICANIAPYEDDRLANRKLISSKGHYFEVYVDTPLEICERRDVKGLYQLARSGVIKAFTGINDPYEIPTQPDIIIDTRQDIASCVDEILHTLQNSYPLF